MENTRISRAFGLLGYVSMEVCHFRFCKALVYSSDAFGFQMDFIVDLKENGIFIANWKWNNTWFEKKKFRTSRPCNLKFFFFKTYS